MVLKDKLLSTTWNVLMPSSSAPTSCGGGLSPQQCKTLNVPTAGRLYFGLSQNGSYVAAQRGDIPTIRIGGRLRVPVAALERMLEQAEQKSDAPK
jgi:hypothetical protein